MSSVIRRYTGREFLLFLHAEHSALAEKLAGMVGGTAIAGPRSVTQLTQALAVHDIAWHEFDLSPRLSPQRYPLDQAEATWQQMLQASRIATARALKIDPYVGLLVSIFGLHQSYDAGRPTEGPLRFDPADLRKKFEVNKYQHAEIETQEAVRLQLGMSIEQSRRFGLSADLNHPAERQLAADVRLMQLIDWLSVAALARELPAAPQNPILSADDSWVTPIISLAEPERVRVSPWPFAEPSIRLRASFRRYPALPTRSIPEFQHAFAGTHEETIEVTFLPGEAVIPAHARATSRSA